MAPAGLHRFRAFLDEHRGVEEAGRLAQKLLQGLSGEAVEIVTKRRVGCPFDELPPQMITGRPASPLTVGHDVSDRLAVHGEDHPLAGPHGIDDLTRLIAEFTHPDLHVR